ncbi:hypothetical protein C4544_04555 [candidate division WS5 bacterium]|uniref:histidine kinase n=1 Tax=candidate division WS5 bacterium TaxID=2093353 RepID=A0A419DC84_9BACT|nr:MAG: hypothetical protein C4544_04555 [candidate division WS5 bacterium]
MHPIALLIIAGGNICLGVITWFYIKRFRQVMVQHAVEAENHEQELKRQVLELQVLRSLGERVGYSLDLRQILEVITDSLSGLVDFSTVSYMLLGNEGKIIYKTRTVQSVSRQFLEQTKNQMLSAFSLMVGQNLQSSLIEDTLTGTATDDLMGEGVKSFFNLPIVVGNKPIALINVSSPKTGLYTDEGTTILYTILDQVSVQASKLSQVIENEKRRLTAMVSSLTDGIMMVDPHYNLIVTNSALWRVLGLDKRLLLPISQTRVNLYEVVAAVGTKADLEGSIKKALTAQILVKIPEFNLDDRVVEIEVEPVKDRFGYLLGAAVVFRDITAAKQLERLREEFTAMMVHELRTPLTTIRYSTDMMLADLSKLKLPDIAQNMQIIGTTTESMLSLVNELLDVAKIESGKFQIVKEKNDLVQLIEEEVSMFKSLVSQKNIGLVADVDKTIIPFEFDKKRIGQALNNLVSNAVKYTDQGNITIHARIIGEGKAGKQVEVSVADTGDGIKIEDMTRLFSKFEQLGKGKTGERGGTGLGLVVTKGIIEAHGGKIKVTSEGEGKGSVFSFTLPCT